jgi:hypothetical protein
VISLKEIDHKDTIAVSKHTLFELTWHYVYTCYKQRKQNIGDHSLDAIRDMLRSDEIIVDEQTLLESYEFVVDLYNDNIESGYEPC